MKSHWFTAILLVFALLTCGCTHEGSAKSEPAGDVYIERPLVTLSTYEEYTDYISETDLPISFVTYDLLSRFGEFRSLVILSDARFGDFHQYMYTLQNEDGNCFSLYVEHDPEDTVNEKDSTLFDSDDVNLSDMRTLPGGNGRGQYNIGGVRYIYRSGSLNTITWYQDGIEFMIALEWGETYSLDSSYTLAQLLCIENKTGNEIVAILGDCTPIA